MWLLFRENFRLNVLIISQHFWPESFRVNEVAEDLVDKLEHVYVLTGKPNYPAGQIFSGYSFWGTQKEEIKGIELYRVPLVPRGNGGSFKMLLNYISFMFFAFFLGPFLLRKKKIDIVFVYGTSPLIQGLIAVPFKLFFKSKLIVWVQDLWPEDLKSTGHLKNQLLLKVNEYPARLLYYLADRVLIQSEAFRFAIGRLSKNKRLYFVPNPAERSVFYDQKSWPLPPELDFMENSFIVTFAGNVGNNQSIETIVNAANQLKNNYNIKIVVVGSGSKSKFLADEINRLNLSNLKAVGRYSSDDMPAIFNYSDALLVTLAKKDNLNWTVPCKVQAYMASGKPIIASLNGEGAKVVMDAMCGVVCDSENYLQLSKCIIDLYKMSSSQRDEMGRNGRLYAEKNYHPKLIVENLVEHFKVTLEEY